MQCRHLNAAHSTDEVCLPSNEWWGEALRPNYHCYTKKTLCQGFFSLFHYTNYDAKYAPGDMFFWHDTCAGQQCTLPGAMDHECTPKRAWTACASWYRQLYCSNVTLPARLFDGSPNQTAATSYNFDMHRECPQRVRAEGHFICAPPRKHHKGGPPTRISVVKSRNRSSGAKIVQMTRKCASFEKKGHLKKFQKSLYLAVNAA